MEALPDILLVTATLHVVQPNYTRTASKLSPCGFSDGKAVTQLSADNCCVSHIPEVITDCTPCVVVEHFDSPFQVVAGVPTVNNSQLHFDDLFCVGGEQVGMGTAIRGSESLQLELKKMWEWEL